MSSLEQDLKDLCAEGNNNDYYLSETVDAWKLEEIIRKYFDPDYRYANPHWGRRPTVDKVLTPEDRLIAAVFERQILTQLEKPLFLNKFIEDDNGA